MKGAWGTDGPIHVADLTGDGKAGRLHVPRDGPHVERERISRGNGFQSGARWTGDWGTDGAINVGDPRRGNGKADVFMHRADGNWSVNLSRGTNFAAYEWPDAVPPAPCLPPPVPRG